MISRKMKIPDFHKISYVLVFIDTLIVGMTGFEPATTRPPAVYATGLRHIPFLFWFSKKTLFDKNQNNN